MRIADHLSGETSLGQCRFVVIQYVSSHRCKSRNGGPTCSHTPIRLGQEQHVIDDARQAVQLLQIGRQHLANIRLLRAQQSQFIVGNERGQRRAQLMRHVRIEAFHLGIGLLNAS